MCRIYKLLIMILFILGLVGCGDNSIINASSDYKDCIVKVQYNGETHIIKKSESESDKYDYIVNNKHIKSIAGTYNDRRYLTLVSTEKVNDLTYNEMITDNVYMSNLESSSAYINYLINLGYRKVYEAYTYKFVELYLHKEDAPYKRVIITDEYMVISDSEYIPDVSIENYLFK